MKPQINAMWRARAAGGLLAALLIAVFATALSLPPGGAFASDPQPEANSPPAAEQHQHDRVAVKVDKKWLKRLGVKTEPVQLAVISRAVRTVATIVPDEARVFHIHTRVAGWIEQLYVATTGQAVEQGQALAAIFSQDLYAAQTEYLAAYSGASAAQGNRAANQLQKSARQRLQVLGMSSAEIAEITRSRVPRSEITIYAPRSGVVLRRSVSVGTAVDPSTELMTLADLTQVWVIAELPEQDIPLATEGAEVQVTIPASGLAPFTARVDFLYPTLSERTRSLRVRIPVPNPERKLRPGMSGSVSFQGESRKVLTVARDALVDTGEMQHVFVQSSRGQFEPRQVRVGMRLPERIEILEGLREGESVVTAGVFMIDSESRLRGSGAAGHAGHGPSTQSPPAAQSPPAVEADPHREHRP